MLINGMQINIPFEDDIILPRIEKDIVLHAVAVPYLEELEKLCPEPEPPAIKDKKGNFLNFDFEDTSYKDKILEWSQQRSDFVVIKSLDNVKWETVDPKDPKTWGNWRKEALASGITELEIKRIIREVQEVHMPTEQSVKKAREAFLAGTRQTTETED